MGHEVLDLILQLQDAGIRSYDEILFMDDNPGKTGYMGYRTLTTDKIFNVYDRSDTSFVIAIGEPLYRKSKIAQIKENGYHFETLIHPTAHVGLNAVIGEGTVVQRGVIVSCDCRIGMNCFLQAYCTIGHNTVIGDDCTVSTNVAVSGGVTIGENTYLAVGVSVIQGAVIGSDSVVGMAAVVIRDIPDNVIALGNPARAMHNKGNEKVFK